MLLLGGVPSCAQEAPKAIDLGVSVKWAAEDVGPGVRHCGLRRMLPEGYHT